MMYIPKAHEIYRHFKGNLYQIVAIATHSETGEELVIYQAMYDDFKIYARPLSMFLEKVDREKYPDVKQTFRFELQNGEDPRLCMTSDADVSAQSTSLPIVQTTEETSSSIEDDGEEPNIDPMVLEFLDADTYEARLNILVGLKHRITDEMITTMAIVTDVDVPEGDTVERYEALKNALVMKNRYECNRMR